MVGLLLIINSARVGRKAIAPSAGCRLEIEYYLIAQYSTEGALSLSALHVLYASTPRLRLGLLATDLDQVFRTDCEVTMFDRSNLISAALSLLLFVLVLLIWHAATDTEVQQGMRLMSTHQLMRKEPRKPPVCQHLRK
jgi:hypothetical protein